MFPKAGQLYLRLKSKEFKDFNIELNRGISITSQWTDVKYLYRTQTHQAVVSRRKPLTVYRLSSSAVVILTTGTGLRCSGSATATWTSHPKKWKSESKNFQRV